MAFYNFLLRSLLQFDKSFLFRLEINGSVLNFYGDVERVIHNRGESIIVIHNVR